jgi:hypothetical protein
MFVDPEHTVGDLQLGTIEHPFASLDDVFRELFNRETNYNPENDEPFDVLVHLKSGNISDPSFAGRIQRYGKGGDTDNWVVPTRHTIHSNDAPLLLININLELR